MHGPIEVTAKASESLVAANLLLLSGDVELNPGPTYSSKNYS